MGRRFLRARLPRLVGEIEGEPAVGPGADAPDAAVEAGSDTLADLIYAGRPLAEAVEAGDLRIEGDRAAFGRFLGLFPPPAGA